MSIKKRIKDWLFYRKIKRIEKHFVDLREMMEERKMGKWDRRKIYKDFLRAVGFYHIRVREKVK